MAVGNTLKNMATAAALVALREKYKKPSPVSKKTDEEAEIGALCDKLNAAKMSLNAGIDRLIARANKGGSSNSELIKITDQVNALAKKMG